MAAVFDQQYCLSGPAIFTINDTYKHSGSWTGGDVKILDGNGSLAFSLEANAWSCKELKVMKDASGNPICSLKQKVWSWKQKWTICKGTTADDSMMVAKASRKRGNLLVELPNGNQSDYSIQARGTWKGPKELDICFQDQVIGHATLQNRAGIFIKNNYQVTIDPGYDHAFALCMVIIMNGYYHSDVNTLLVAH